MFIVFHEPPPNMHEGKYEPRKHFEPLKEMNFAFGEVSFDTESARGKVIARLPINGFVPSTEDFAADWKDIRNAIGSILSSIADAGKYSPKFWFLPDLRRRSDCRPSVQPRWPT